MNVSFNVDKKKYFGIIKDGFLYHNCFSFYRYNTGIKLPKENDYRFRNKLAKNRFDEKTNTYRYHRYSNDIIIRPTTEAKIKEHFQKKALQEKARKEKQKEINKLKKLLPKKLFGYDMRYTTKEMLFGCGRVRVNYDDLPEIIRYLSTNTFSKQVIDVVNEAKARVPEKYLVAAIPQLRKISNAISKGAKTNNP